MPFQLLLLIMLSVRSECQSVGKEFVAVFPENIAYYHPSVPQNKLRITALYNDTTVWLLPSSNSKLETLHSGDIREVDIVADMELDKKEILAKMVTINSSENIALEILSHREKSTQTALLFPYEQLGKEYKIPPIPKIQKTTQPLSRVTTAVTERSPFKLIIGNKEAANKITIKDSSYNPVTLEPGQVRQIWVTTNMVGKTVTGTKPFLAIFSHSCAIHFNCTCGVLYTPLQPSISTATSTFIVPPVLREGAEGQTYLLKPSNGQTVDFSEGNLKVRGSLVLQRPGMLLNLIPEEQFGSCFAIQTVTNAKNWAIIVTPAASTGDVQIGNSPAQGEWKPISGTHNKYKYAKVELREKKNIIWNKFERMGVWFFGTFNDSAVFGHPAARLSVNPDYRGCVVTPDKIEVLQETSSWKESIQACKSRNMSLITLSNKDFQNQVYKRLLDLKQNQNDLWMGMRKSSYLGVWYWLNNDHLEHVDWSQGAPDSDSEAGCAQINLKDSKNPGWINKHCCNQGKAVCYKDPELLTIGPDGDDDSQDED